MAQNITMAVYSFHRNQVYVKVPFPITKETEKCYFTQNGNKFLKSELNTPRILYTTAYPYVEICMVDADEETLRAKLCEWFATKVTHIQQRIV